MLVADRHYIFRSKDATQEVLAPLGLHIYLYKYRYKCKYTIYLFSQDEISTEALKCLYGTSRPSEIEDVVNNVSKKETGTVNIDEETAKKDKEKKQEEEFKVPKFADVVNYVWDQMQKRKKGSNSKHRFVVNNQVLQFHPLIYQEVSSSFG